jgi:hypothetical protein
MQWFEVRVDGVIRIDRVAAVFDVWVGANLPFPEFKVKIIERFGKGFLGLPNVAVRNPKTGNPECISGLGETIEDALSDTLASFFREIESNRPEHALTDDDFAWSAAEDF